MKKLNNNYEAPKAEWVELFAENEVICGTWGTGQTGSESSL